MAPKVVWGLLWITVCAAVGAVEPTPLGCSLDITDGTIRCRNTNLTNIVFATFVLVPDIKPTVTTINSNSADAVITSSTAVPITSSNNIPNNVSTISADDLNVNVSNFTVDDNVTTTSTVTTESTTTTSTTSAAPVSVYSGQRNIDIREVDIFSCDITELNNIFSRFNSTLERIRVAKCGITHVNINAFNALESKLRHLDLSGNKLQAVPLAIQNLTRLEVLNLRDNKISAIAEGPTFANTLHLRELHLGFNNLGYIENNRLQIYPSTARGANRKQTSQTPSIGMAVFNLGNSTNTLEILSLRGNNMHIFPDQLTKSFPRLKSLDLSFNSLIELPDEAFQFMPELQFINLDSNLIRSLRAGILPASLKVFTMKNNPLRCDCDSKWILDWIFTNTSLTVMLPKCNAPFHLRDHSLLQLKSERLCHHNNDTRQTVYVTDRDLGYFPVGIYQSLRLLDVHGEFKSVYVSWKVDPQFYLSQREWIILYRRFEDSIYTFNRTAFTSKNYVENQTDWNSGERIFSDTIRNLTAGKYYQVCMAVVESNINYIHLNHCRVAQSEKEVLQQVSLHPSDGAVDNAVTTAAPVPIPDYLVKSNLVKLKAESDSITVFWSVIVQSQHNIAYDKDSEEDNDGSDEDDESREKSKTPASQMQRPESLESPLVLGTLAAIYNELQWKITFRKFTTEATTVVTITKNNYVITGPNTHQYTIANLLPDTGYTVCFQTTGNLPTEAMFGMKDSVVEMGKGKGPSAEGAKPSETFPVSAALANHKPECREVLTAQLEQLPSSAIAIGCAISIAVTAIAVSVLWCLLPRAVAKWRQKAQDAKNASNKDTKGGDDKLGGHDEDDSDEYDVRARLSLQNGHLPAQVSGGYPRLTVYPKEGQMNPLFYGSLRNTNGLAAYPAAVQRSGTYPRSILKKSPSAPSLSEATKAGLAPRNGEKILRPALGYEDDDNDAPIVIHIKDDDVELKDITVENKNGGSSLGYDSRG